MCEQHNAPPDRPVVHIGLAYCPNCDELTALVRHGICAWCDTTLVPAEHRDTSTLLTDHELRVLHRIHTEHGLTVRDLGRGCWSRKGFASAANATMAISTGWHRLRLTPHTEAAAA